MQTRNCPKCRNDLPLKDFHKDNKRKDGLQLWCNECGKASKKRNYYSHRKAAVLALSRKYVLKRNYGITPQDYEDMSERQGGVCAICRKPETQSSCKNGTIDSLRVDHDHKTGKVRGLLCSRCNFAIGHLQDNMDNLMSACGYLTDANDQDYPRASELIASGKSYIEEVITSD